MTRPVSDIDTVLQLKALGLTDREVSRQSGVPVSTIRTWRRRRRSGPPAAHCADCGGAPHRWDDLDADNYAYVLGMYLGDGYLIRWGRQWTLRISLDSAYPAIVDECRAAISRLRGSDAMVHPDSTGKGCVHVRSGWRSWPCLLPQRGRGRKHQRAITLTDWQQRIVDAAPGSLLRGLIQTDGWRGVNRVRVKGREYEYPRYQFSNRSDDIRGLFTAACDRLGIEWRPWTRYHVSVAKRESVAILDGVVGPKR